MIQYLIASFFSVLSNCLAVFFVKKGFLVLENGQLVMDIFLHTNIINMFNFIILFQIQKARGKVNFRVIDTFRGKQEIVQFLLFFFPVIASIYKTYLLGIIPVTTITISSMITPFVIWLLAVFLLKERMQTSYIKYCFISVIGFLLVNIQKMDGAWGFNNIQYLLLYIFIFSFGQITTRYYCKKRAYELQAVMAEMVIFFIYALAFLFLRKSFSFRMLFNPYVWIIALCCFSRNVLTVNGVRKASSIVALEFCSFAKPIFACILMFLLVGEIPTFIKVIGMIIIAFAIVMFHTLERKDKQMRKAKGQKLYDEKTIEKIQEQINENAENLQK